MNRRHLLRSSLAATAAVFGSVIASSALLSGAPQATGEPGVAVLLVDTDKTMAPVDERIYGHFLEHINHSVVDGLYAEQIRGQGFEGEDFGTYWEPFSDNGSVELAGVEFENGQKSVRLDAARRHAPGSGRAASTSKRGRSTMARSGSG